MPDGGFGGIGGDTGDLGFGEVLHGLGVVVEHVLIQGEVGGLQSGESGSELTDRRGVGAFDLPAHAFDQCFCGREVDVGGCGWFEGLVDGAEEVVQSVRWVVEMGYDLAGLATERSPTLISARTMRRRARWVESYWAYVAEVRRPSCNRPARR
jgi:hypothetical protein